MNAIATAGPDALAEKNRAAGCGRVETPPLAAPPAKAPDGSFSELCARLARMLGRGEPVSESEAHQATLALACLLEAPNPAQHLAQHHPTLPVALHPLLLTLLSAAWAEADSGLALALEEQHRTLVRARAGAEARDGRPS